MKKKLDKISKELVGASKMHKKQSKQLTGASKLHARQSRDIRELVRKASRNALAKK